jgi:molybdate transport system ATP-binding protein
LSIKVSIRKRLSRIFTLDVEFETRENPASPGGPASPGSCMGILGVSGSGKSMTLKCIAGIETPDEGRIEVNGRILFDSAKKINLKPQVRKVGYLFQNYALFPGMTVLENVAAGLKDRAARDLSMDWLKRFGLAEHADRYPRELSGGQQQRCALARMLIREPEVILLDEPFSALDTNLREQMQIQFQELLTTRKDAIMVTHSRDEAYRLCAEILVMDAGRALGRGETKALFANPGLVRIARLTGCKNISPVKITGAQELYALDWGLSLRTAAPIAPDITHVGIRAHDLIPVRPDTTPETTGGTPGNRVRIKILQHSEEPFEHAVLFTNAAAQSPAEQGEIWWKYSKSGDQRIPEELFIPPPALFLLR